MRLFRNVNLFRDGYVRCALRVIEHLYDRKRMVYVHVARDGTVHCNTDRITNRLPHGDLIGAYTTRAMTGHVEADLLAWLHENVMARSSTGNKPSGEATSA